MKKITQEDIENEYKEAIREKFRFEKIEGKHSHYLNNPSQALLRDLCWEIFNSEPKADDLAVYRNFFKSDFIPREEDNSQQHTDKFKKVGAFLRGGIQPAKISTVELAAILVDLENRPLKKFIKNKIDQGESLNDKDVLSEKQKVKRNENCEDQITSKTDTESGFDKIEDSPPFVKPKSINFFINVREKILKNFRERLIKTAIATIFIFGLIGAVIYFAFFKKHCMQWSEDHYEVVDCSSNNDSNLNVVIPLDEDLLEFRKIRACDTTSCFLTNGEAFIWYGKTANGIDFFNDNGNGRHPETGKSLRPVTNYIFNRYLKNKPCN